MTPDPKSPFYPYERVESYGTLPLLENVPCMLRDYLMDMPSKGYTPPDNNDYPRCALMKYLYYDDAEPLNNPVPTLEQKKSILFDPRRPDTPPTSKGYRIFSQTLTSEAQVTGQTIMRIFMGRTVATGNFRTDVGLQFSFLTNAAYDSNTRTSALSRTFAMACLTVRALNGVHLGAGAGTVYFDRQQHADCGIRPINDESNNVGYSLMMGLTIMGSQEYDPIGNMR